MPNNSVKLGIPNIGTIHFSLNLDIYVEVKPEHINTKGFGTKVIVVQGNAKLVCFTVNETFSLAFYFKLLENLYKIVSYKNKNLFITGNLIELEVLHNYIVCLYADSSNQEDMYDFLVKSFNEKYKVIEEEVSLC